MSTTSDEAVELFFSYAHEDEALLKALQNHLSTLKRQGFITQWHNGKIIAGQERANEIDAYLNTAQVILLLISADFTASDYCSSHEMTRAMERHHTGEARIIPIILRPTDWKGTPFEKLQVLPTNAKPVTSWLDPDEAFLDIVEGIRAVIDDIRQQFPSEHALSYPTSNLPYERNLLFTGRKDILDRLHTTFEDGKTMAITQAITGLGGIGKTQTALQYCYLYQNEYDTILWMYADSQETLLASATTMMQQLNLFKHDQQDAEIILSTIKRWLQTHSRWLLVLDNADDFSVLKGFLPTRSQGHVLITTRMHTVGNINQCLEIEQMSQEEDALFLLRRAGYVSFNEALFNASPPDQTDALEISSLLAGLPLALDQAGAYIQETGCSLSEYCQLYKTRQSDLLRRRGKQAHDDHPEPVATTWSLSFEKVQNANPAAIELLFLCSFLDPDIIPLEIITEGASVLGSPLKQVAQDPIKLNEIIGDLLNYSLVHRNADQSLTMHHLMQAVLLESMSKKTRRIWATRAIRAINQAFPEATYENWLHCLQYLPQIQRCVMLIDTWNIASKETAYLLTKVALYLWQSGAYTQGIPLLQRALKIREQVLGPEHPDTAASLNNLAFLYNHQGKYKEAEPLLLQALVIWEQMLGPEHPDVAACLDNLAGLYKYQGKYEEAESLYQRALMIWEQELGPDHPQTAMSLNNLAVLYRTQGKYEEAEPLDQRVLTIREQVLGPDHPDTATSLNNLAVLYRTQGKYEEAEPLLQRALKIREQVSGPDHPETASILNNLSGLYNAQGKYEKAESILQRALKISEQVLGPEHPNVAINLSNLALLYKDQGKYEEAESLYQQALKIREQVLGSDHPDTAGSLNNLTQLYYHQGKYEKAEPLLQRVLKIREQVLGPEHPDVAINLSNLALLYKDQGKYEEAEPLLHRALEIIEQGPGPDYHQVVICVNNLAFLYSKQEKYEEAEPLYQRALEIIERELGPDHLQTATSLNNLAFLYSRQEKYGEAEPLYQRVLKIIEPILGLEHPNTATSLNNLAFLYSEQGKYEEAEPLYQRALKIYEQVVGPEHPDIASILNDLANLYSEQKKKDNTSNK